MILTKFTGFMHVLSLHKSAKFGCFISITDKIINNLPRWGHFQPNIQWPLAAKLFMGPKKSLGWNDGTTSIIMQNLVKIEFTHDGVRGRSWCFSLCLFFENNAVGRRPLRCVVELLPQDITSAFVGRFRWGLHLFCGRKALSSKFSKLSLGGATIGAWMAK